MSVPVRFPGTTAERDRNIASHFWVDDGDAGVCNDCDCKPFSVKATWPCGADVPRMSTGTATLTGTLEVASTSITIPWPGLADPKDRWLVESWLHWKFRLWRTK